MGAGFSGLTGSDRTHLTIGIGSLALFWLIYRTTKNNGGGDDSIVSCSTQTEPFQNRRLDNRDHDDIPSLPEIVPEGRFRHIHFDEDERPAPWHPNTNRKLLSENSLSITDTSNPNAKRNTKIQLMRETTFDRLSEDEPLATRMVCHHHFETPVVATEPKRPLRCQTKRSVRNKESLAETRQDSVRGRLAANNDKTDSSSTIRSNKLTNKGKKYKNNDDSREKDMQVAVNGPIIVNHSRIRSTDEEKVLKSIILSNNSLLPLIYSNTRVETTPELENISYKYSNGFNCNNEINHVPSTLPLIASFCQITPPPPPPPVVNFLPTKKLMPNIIPKKKVDESYLNEDNMSLFSSNSIRESLTRLKKTPPLSAVASKIVSYSSTTARDSRDSDLEKGTCYIASDRLLKKSKDKLKYPASLDISALSENTLLNKSSIVPSVEEDYKYNLRKTITPVNSALSATNSATQLSLLPVTSNSNLEVMSIASTTKSERTDYSDKGVFALLSQLPMIDSSADVQPPPPSPIQSPLGRLYSDSRTKSLESNPSTLALGPLTSRKETVHGVSSKSQKKNGPTQKDTSLISRHSNLTVQMSAHYVPSADISTLFDNIDGCFIEGLCIPKFHHGKEIKSFANEQTMPSTSSTRTLPKVNFVPSKRNESMENEICSSASIQYSNREQISSLLESLSSSSRTFPGVPYESKDRFTHFRDSIPPSSTFLTKDPSSTTKQSSLVTSIYDDPDGSSYEELSVLPNSPRKHTSDENTLGSSATTTYILPNVPSKSKRHDGIHSIHNNDSRIESIGSVLPNSSIESLKSIKTSLPDVSSLSKYKNEGEPVGSSIIDKDEGLQVGISSVHTNHSRTDQVVSISPSQSKSFYSPRSLHSVPRDSRNDNELVLKAIPSVVIMNQVRTDYQLKPPLVGSVASINTSFKYDNIYSSLDEDYVAYIPSRDLMEKSQIQKQTEPVRIPLKIQSSHTQYSDSLFSVTSSNNSLQDPVMTLISQKSVSLTSVEKSIENDQHEYSDYELSDDGHSVPIQKQSLKENSSLTHAKASITFKMDNYLSNIDISPEDEVITEPSAVTLCQKSETCLSKLNEEVQLLGEINNMGVPSTTPIYFQHVISQPIDSLITVKTSSSKLETDMDILNYDIMPEIKVTKMIREKIQRKEVSRGLSQPKQFTESRLRILKRDPREKIFAPVHSKKVAPLTRRSVEEVTAEHNRNKPRRIIIEPDLEQPSTSKKKKWTK